MGESIIDLFDKPGRGHFIFKWSGIAIHKDLSEDDKLYHYYTMKNFIRLYKSKELHLTHIYDWDDPWELPYRLSKDEKRHGFINYMLIDANSSLKNDRPHIHTEAKGVCFTKNEDCDFMWRNFTNNNGVCVETTVKDLIDSIKDNPIGTLFIAPIEYIDISKNPKEILLSDKRAYYPYTSWMAYIKRSNFKHESEIRMIIEPPTPFSRLANIKINLDKYINKIVLSPDISDKECDCDWNTHKEQRVELFKKDFPKINCEVDVSSIYRCNDISYDAWDKSEMQKIMATRSIFPKDCKMIYYVDNDGNIINWDSDGNRVK